MSRRREIRRHPARMAAARQPVAHGARPPAAVGMVTNEGRDRLDHYARVFARIGAGGGRDRIWGTMTYACRGDLHAQIAAIREEAPGQDAVSVLMQRGGPRGCGFERKVQLGIGVEGPRSLREEGAFIPAPAHAGSCPDCGASLAHVRWNEDEVLPDFPAARRSVALFRVPSGHRARELAATGYGGTELVEPQA